MGIPRATYGKNSTRYILSRNYSAHLRYERNRRDMKNEGASSSKLMVGGVLVDAINMRLASMLRGCR